MSTEMDLPVAVVVRVTATSTTRLIEVACPYGCRRRHSHGWPYGHEDIGSRVSHCRKPNAGYEIAVPVLGGPAYRSTGRTR
jgi:hypothetical protein